jgi:cytochrome c-type biogenesis protein CcmE
MKQSTLIKVVATVAGALGLLAILIFTSRADSARYAMIDVLMAAPDKWTDGDMKIHGWVEPGSIKPYTEDGITKRTFVLTKGGKRVMVRFTGAPPDTFEDQSEVVASGRLHKLPSGDYEFTAQELMAKCPSKYEGAESNKRLTTKPALQ